MNGAEGEALFRVWGDENPDERREMEMVENASGKPWRANFKTKVRDLGAFRPRSARPLEAAAVVDEQGRLISKVKEGPLMDPVQRDQEKATFGVRQARFEEHFEEVKEAVDGFLDVELGFEVGKMEFVRGREGVTAVG